MTRSVRAALAAVPGAVLLWLVGAWWWSSGLAGAVFSRDVEAPTVAELGDGLHTSESVFITYGSLLELIALGLLGVLVGVAGAALAARPARRLVLLVASLGTVGTATAIVHLVAPLDADWPPAAVGAVLVATCALMARRPRAT